MDTQKQVETTETTERERVYDFPNGYQEQAENMCRWLRRENFSPELDVGQRDGEYRMGITIPVREVPQLRIFQKTYPARWGNPPDIEKAMDDNRREMEEQSKVCQEKLDKLTPEQREWIEVIHSETGLYLPQALDLNEQLHELAAQHFKLNHMDSESGLDERQSLVRDVIEQRVAEALNGVPGIKGPHFSYDPRGTTVGVIFESGHTNSLTGSWKVPLNPKRVKALGKEPFWEAYPVETDDTPRYAGREAAADDSTPASGDTDSAGYGTR